MAKRAKNLPKGLPTQKQVLEFIQSSDSPVGKREIARAFGLKGQEKIALKKLLKDMAEEGLIDGKKTAFHRMGGLPKVTVLRVVELDDGEPIAVPEKWEPDDGAAPPRLTVVEKARGRDGKARGMPALKVGDRILSRTEETPKGWRAHPMKRLPQSTEGLIGVVEKDGRGKFWLAPVDKKVRSSTPITDTGTAEEGQLVVAEPTGKGTRSGVRVTEVLGDPLAPNSFSMIAIAKHGIPHVFPEAVIREAELAATLPVTPDKREDLRHLPIIAIDPADARDHDDAIWAEPDDDENNAGGFRAVVAIADVSHYVRPGSALDKEARKRGNSVYFPDRVVPMLPEVLSADVCSLRAGEDRAAMACHLKISPEGKLLKWRFSRAIVRIAEVIAYEEAQRYADNDFKPLPARGGVGEGRTAPEASETHPPTPSHKGGGELPANLQNLWAAWHALFAAREARDPLDLDLPERRVILDEEGGIAEIAVRERLDAHRVVEEYMIAANVAAAKALEAKNAPVVYRVHEQPSREKLLALKEYLGTQDKKLALGQVVTPTLFNRFLKDVSDEQEKALLMEAVLRTQTQAYYGPANQGHFGLALGSYAHFTSPIRRYADLLVHRALVDAFGLEQPKPQGNLASKLPEKSGLSDADRDDLGKISEAISQTERRAMEAERDTIDRYVAAWLGGRVGETFQTRITGVLNFGFFATILGLGGDGLVPISTLGDEYFHFDEAAKALIGADTGTRYETGQRLEMKLVEANPLTGALRFEVPGGDASKARKGRPLRSKPRGAGQGKPGPKKVAPRKDGPRKDGPRKDKAGKHTVGKRGRPGNIRHQGRKR